MWNSYDYIKLGLRKIAHLQHSKQSLHLRIFKKSTSKTGSAPRPCLCSLCGAWTPVGSWSEGLSLLEHLPRCAPGQRPVWTGLPAAPSLLENRLWAPLDLFWILYFKYQHSSRHLVGPTAVHCAGPCAEPASGLAGPCRLGPWCRISLLFVNLMLTKRQSWLLWAANKEHGCLEPPRRPPWRCPLVTRLDVFAQSCLQGGSSESRGRQWESLPRLWNQNIWLPFTLSGIIFILQASSVSMNRRKGMTLNFAQ